MCKRVLVCVITVLLALSLCGCWNYRGLDQLDLVVGIAIDFDRETNKYKICYEVADTQSAQDDSNTMGKLIVSEGKTLFDAARNAKRVEAGRLFFGSTYIIVISQQLAQETGISDVLEWFLRDGECRETMYIAISQNETAKSILEGGEETGGIISVDLRDIIAEDSKVTSSSINSQLYEIYNMINSPRDSTMLPALKKDKVGDKETSQLNGIAVCKKDNLVGFLSPKESKYALFVEDKIKGGILTLSSGGTPTDDISLEIFDNKTKKSCKYEQGKVKVRIETDTITSIGENQKELDIMDDRLVKDLEDTASKMVEKNIKKVIHKAQSEFHADVFGFGEMLYKHDLPVWKQLEPDWNQIFPKVEVTVSSKVHIKYSGFLR